MLQRALAWYRIVADASATLKGVLREVGIGNEQLACVPRGAMTGR
jgi:hypothetical protein